MLEKLRSGEPLTAKEKQIHDQDLVTVLRQIHDELDEAALEAYGWEDCSGDHRSPRLDRSGEDDSRRPVIAATLPDQVAILRKLIGNHDKSVVAPY